MQTGLAYTLAKLADRNLPETERTTLLANLGSKEHRLEIMLKRNSMTLGRNIPEYYKDGRTLTGKIGEQEVTVLIPKDQKEDIGSLKRGATVTLSARYHEFDTFHRRVTFTGNLQVGQTPSEPAIPTVEPLQPLESEPNGEPEATVPEPLPEPPETEEHQAIEEVAKHSEPEVKELPPAIKEEKLPAEEDVSSPKIVTGQNDFEEPAQTLPPPGEPEPPSVPTPPDPPPSKEPELPSVPRPPFEDALRGQEPIPLEERISKYEASLPKLDQRKTLVKNGQNIVFWCSCLLWILAIPLTLFLFFKVFLN